MNFTSLPDINPGSPKIIIHSDSNLLQVRVDNDPVFQQNNENHNYCDKPLRTSSLDNNLQNENRDTEWTNLTVKNSSGSHGKSYAGFHAATITSTPIEEVVWQSPKPTTKNASTMTDIEIPTNLYNTHDSNKLVASNKRNTLYYNLNEDVCPKVHLQRQETAMATYLARLQPSTLNIQEFLKLYNVKPAIKIDINKTDYSSNPKNKFSISTTALNSDGAAIFNCSECGMEFLGKENFDTHIAAHNAERRFKCDVCGACLKRKEHLEQHKRRHSEDRPYVCEICCKGFKRNEHLRRHIVIHSGYKMYPCTICQKSFSRKDHLNKHITTHSLKRYRSNHDVDVLLINKPIQ